MVLDSDIPMTKIKTPNILKRKSDPTKIIEIK